METSTLTYCTPKRSNRSGASGERPERAATLRGPPTRRLRVRVLWSEARQRPASSDAADPTQPRWQRPRQQPGHGLCALRRGESEDDLDSAEDVRGAAKLRWLDDVADVGALDPLLEREYGLPRLQERWLPDRAAPGARARLDRALPKESVARGHVRELLRGTRVR